MITHKELVPGKLYKFVSSRIIDVLTDHSISVQHVVEQDLMMHQCLFIYLSTTLTCYADWAWLRLLYKDQVIKVLCKSTDEFKEVS